MKMRRGKGDYQKMREFLEGLDCKGFIAFSKSCGDRIPELTDGGKAKQDAGGTTVSLPFEDHKPGAIERILKCKSESPDDWRRYCHHAGIDTDDVVALEATKTSARHARLKTWVLCVATAMAGLSFFGWTWKELKTLFE